MVWSFKLFRYIMIELPHWSRMASVEPRWWFGVLLAASARDSDSKQGPHLAEPPETETAFSAIDASSTDHARCMMMIWAVPSHTQGLSLELTPRSE